MRNILILAVLSCGVGIVAVEGRGADAPFFGECVGGRCPLPKRSESAAVPSPIIPLAAPLPLAPVVLQQQSFPVVRASNPMGVWRPFQRVRLRAGVPVIRAFACR